MKKKNIAIIGATGMVGRTLLKVLEERDFPFDQLYCIASEEYVNTTLKCKGKDYSVEGLTKEVFQRDIDIAFFSAGEEVSKKFAPIAAKEGIIVIDNSNAFRMDKEIPLVVPEVNGHVLKHHKNIISNPNCSTIQAVVALKPLHDQYGIKRVIISTYQSVSGSGLKGMTDLEKGFQGQKSFEAYPHSIADNCLPHIDDFLDNGYTKEEMKMIQETCKILEDKTIMVTATAVRVPMFYCHSEALNIELKKTYNLKDIYQLYKAFQCITLQDQPSENIYPLASKAINTDAVYIGRIRRDFSQENTLNLWVVADNIRKGAATNAIQIAESLIQP